MTFPTRAFGMFDDLRLEREDFISRVHRRFRMLTSALFSTLMGITSRVARQSLLGAPDAPTVTLTSHGRRVRRVNRTIESIGRGTLRPSRVVLWLDDPSVYENLPAALLRQQSRGLEVKLTNNLGPHTKYYPLVIEEPRRAASFATADDDILYPRWWLKRLVQAAVETPANIVCHRAHRITLRGARLAPYDAWESVRTTVANPSVFATGVSGVLYPPAMAEALRNAKRGFVKSCPFADDVWLHRIAMEHQILVRQVADVPKHFWIARGSQQGALMDRNMTGGNDAAIAALYGIEQVTLLRRSTDSWNTAEGLKG